MGNIRIQLQLLANHLTGLRSATDEDAADLQIQPSHQIHRAPP